jgi:hypothetical protein
MKNCEFIDYKVYPEDQYVDAIARVKHNGEIKHFAKKKMKDGGVFWTRASISVTHNGEKKYFKDYSDSSLEEEMIIEFVKENVKASQAPKPTSKGQYYPHGMTQQNSMPPMPPAQSMDEVAANEALPF